MSLQGKKLGFIGTGKMGSALIKGICGAGLFTPSDVYASDLYEPSLEDLKQNTGINVSTDNKVTVTNSDIIVLAVKPQILRPVIAAMKEDVTGNKLIISIAAGVKLEDIEKEFDEGTRVVRVMPNIAATVAEAASAITQGKNASNEDAEDALSIFRSVGSAIQVSENLMDAVTGLSGSGPAYIFPIIEAMADGAVYEGLDRNSALILAAQTVIGAAKMVLETGMHPGELKDMVTSPAGTTIRGIRVLEECGVRAAFMKAVIESSNRSKELAK
ncbi:pyrroline-5-carboxylate reductase [Methanolobus psychrotolerans]|uniref:pyrroline-5-carboxylate reductase n=1 Tax=Methanolobus psychrotolerans TaxID=1874706 RepID=UPI001A90DE46|nr:pyrroline-5-carboxylate reductase [Methanolobus psychrotolerans]